MDDYILREDALVVARNVPVRGLDILGYLEAIPPADVKPVVRGTWLTQEYMCGTEDYEDGWIERVAEEGDEAYCSVCGASAGFDKRKNCLLSNFCLNCGADMRKLVRK